MHLKVSLSMLSVDYRHKSSSFHEGKSSVFRSAAAEASISAAVAATRESSFIRLFLAFVSALPSRPEPRSSSLPSLLLRCLCLSEVDVTAAQERSD